MGSAPWKHCFRFWGSTSPPLPSNLAGVEVHEEPAGDKEDPMMVTADMTNEGILGKRAADDDKVDVLEGDDDKVVPNVGYTGVGSGEVTTGDTPSVQETPAGNTPGVQEMSAGLKPTNKTWEWNTTLRTKFKLAKEEIIHRVKNGVKYYDIKRLTRVSTDWSKVGIRMPVTQKHCNCSLENAPRCCKDGFKIIFAGSRRCSGAESRYAPIEGEALGVVWSLEKVRMFTLRCNCGPSASHLHSGGIVPG